MRGGGGIYLPSREFLWDAEHERDLTIASRAANVAKSRLIARKAAGVAAPRDATEHYAMAGMVRQLRSSDYSRLTVKQRAWAMDVAGLKELPPLPDTVKPAPLPLKPPGRR